MTPISRTELKPRSWTAIIPFGLGIVVIVAAQKSGTGFLYFLGGFSIIASLLLFWFFTANKTDP